MKLSQVPVGCIIEFHPKYFGTEFGTSFKLTDKDGKGFFSFVSAESSHATWTNRPMPWDLEVSIVGGFENIVPVDSSAAIQALLNLIGDPCTTTVTSNTTVPIVTYLLDTGALIT